MTNAKQLSKLDIAITFISNIRHLIPLIILVIINLKGFDFMKSLWGILAAVLLVILNGVFSFLSWKKFQYSLEQDRIIIRKGVLNREEKTIYYNRIHSVNVQQPLLLRIFGAASLQIETPGGKPGQAEGKLRVLKHGYALELQQQLKHLRSANADAKQAGGANELTGQGKTISNPEEAAELIAEQSSGQSVHEQWKAGPSSSEPVHGQWQDGPSSSQSAHGQWEAGPSSSEPVHEHGQVGPSSSQSVQGHWQAEQSSEQLRNGPYTEDRYDYYYHISFGQLLKASLTSLNLNFALIFIFGIYSFADDVLEVVFPGLYDKLLNGIIDQYSALPIILLLGLTLLVLGFVWLLSIAIYLIKFGDFQISRTLEQLSVSYGLLEKKSFIFDQNKVQAVIMDENPLRQWLGFAELRVQVITSNAMEQLVIHPFVRKKDISAIMEQLLPDRKLDLREQLLAPPRSAYRTYALLPLIIALLAAAGAIWWWKWNGLWLLLLLPVIAIWRLLCMRSAGVWLEGNDLILRKRSVNRTTYFVRRKHIVTLSMKASPIQRKRQLHNIHVQVLGSVFAYRVKSIADEHLLPIWSWYSRRTKE